MRHTNISRSLAAVFAASFAALASFAAGEEFPPREVTVRVQADGSHCTVETTKLLCAEVVSHLRGVLKLPAGARVHLQPDSAAKYESVMKVVDMLNMSEYPLPVGYLAPEYKD